MANKRMFSKTITNSSQFLMMPQSSQNLYFHLGMNSDDDGFCEHFGIMRMTDSKPDDLKVLQAKGFVQVFDDRVLVITHWKDNNYIRSDRYTPSKYLEIYKEELKSISTPVIEFTKLENKEDVLDDYKKGIRFRKPYYQESEMRWSQNKWWVIQDGEWKSFAGEEKDIIFK